VGSLAGGSSAGNLVGARIEVDPGGEAKVTFQSVRPATGRLLHTSSRASRFGNLRARGLHGISVRVAGAVRNGPTAERRDWQLQSRASSDIHCTNQHRTVTRANVRAAPPLQLIQPLPANVSPRRYTAKPTASPPAFAGGPRPACLPPVAVADRVARERPLLRVAVRTRARRDPGLTISDRAQWPPRSEDVRSSRLFVPRRFAPVNRTQRRLSNRSDLNPPHRGGVLVVATTAARSSFGMPPLT